MSSTKSRACSTMKHQHYYHAIVLLEANGIDKRSEGEVLWRNSFDDCWRWMWFAA